MAGAFPDVTVLHADEDWCEYVVQHLQSCVSTEPINLTDTHAGDQNEVKAAVTNSRVVILLVTCNFLEELRARRKWLEPTLRTRDASITTVVAATVDVAAETLTDVAETCKYDICNWTIIDIEVTGNNIKERINQIQRMVDANVGSLVRRQQAQGTIVDPSHVNVVGTHDDVQIIPRTVEGEGDKVALIFSREKPRGSVAVYAHGVLIQSEHVNPFTVTFLVPEIRNGEILIQVKVNNNMFDRICLYTRGTPKFTSVELLHQIHRVTSNGQLDQLLADKFTSSLSSDGRDTKIFSKLVEHTHRGKHDAEYPTLLHWVAANGLQKLCSAMLKSPGALQACHMLNCNGDDVADLAKKHGYQQIADLIYDSIECNQVELTSDLYLRTEYVNKPPEDVSDYVVPESLFMDASSERTHKDTMIEVYGRMKDQQRQCPDISERYTPAPTSLNHPDVHAAFKGTTSLADLHSTGLRHKTKAVRSQNKTVSMFNFNNRDSGISTSGDPNSNSGSSAEEIERPAAQCPPPVPSRRFGRRMSEPAVQKRNEVILCSQEELYSEATYY